MINLFCIRPKGFNVGNDAIYLGMQHFLYEAFGQVVNLISLPATSRYESQAKAGLTAKTIYEINQYGHGVIVGGGNLYENGELEVNLDALETLEVPMMLFSLSRGRVYNRQHRLVDRTDAMPARIISALNRRANYSLVRDKATYNYLQSIGCDRAQLGGCPTIFLNRISDRLPPLFERDRSGVLISVRNPSLMSIPLRKQTQVRRDILGIIDFLREKGFQDIRLLCHDHRDIPYAASFTDVDYVYTGDIYTYLAMLQSSALSIAYRLHASLPCLSFGTPTIKISYDERALSLMDTIGLQDWNIDMVQTDDVVEQVIDRYHHLPTFDALRQQIQPRWQHFYEVATSTFHKFAADVLEYSEQSRIVDLEVKE
jgi:polysaccharide pyruvyl transferase WcaK-like protein